MAHATDEHHDYPNIVTAGVAAVPQKHMYDIGAELADWGGVLYEEDVQAAAADDHQWNTAAAETTVGMMHMTM